MQPDTTPTHYAVEINGNKVHVPTAWEHCDQATALRICEDLNDGTQVFDIDELNDAEKLFGYRLLLTAKLLGVDMEFINRYSHQEKEQFIGKMHQLMKLSDWLFVPVKDEEGNPTERLRINTGMTNIRSIVSDIKIPKLKGQKAMDLVGPDNNGANLCFAEFIECDEAFQVYCRSKSENLKLAALTNIAATLYREQLSFRESLKSKHDRRVPYQSNFARYSINQRYAAIESIPIAQRRPLLHVIFFFWASYRERIMRKYPLCFTASEDAKPHPYGWDAVIDSFSSGFTETDTIKGKPVDEVFKILSIKEYNRQQAEMAAL